MKELVVPSGTQVMLGAPAQPLDASVVSTVGDLVSSIEGIAEAHLPQCFILGLMDAPEQVLVVVLEAGADRVDVLNQIGAGLPRVLPRGPDLQVWPVSEDDGLIGTVRGTGCQVCGATVSQRW